jgi:hypothetical protein
LPDFNETRTFSTDFGKVLTFHENPSSGSRIVFGQTDIQTDRLMNLIVAFSNFAEESRNGFSSERTGRRGLNLIQAKEKLARCCECGYEPSVSTKCGEFLE